MAKAFVTAIIGWALFLLVAIASMITHVFVCIKAHLWFLLLAGIIAPPVGIFHGFLHWFGVW